MTAKNKGGSGRVTPKGTKNPTKATKRDRPGLPETAGGNTVHEPSAAKTDRTGKQSGKVARPTSHNRGNR